MMMMNKYLLLTALILGAAPIWAQLSQADSIWLCNVLTGKKELKLNDETLRAIRSGTLINFGKPAGEISKIGPELPLAKSFDIRPSTIDTISPLNPDLMDPYLYFKYFFIFADRPLIKPEKPIPGFDLRSANLQFNPLAPIDANRGVTIMRPYGVAPFNGVSVPVDVDFNDVLSRMFSPTYRRRAYNKEHAKAWKEYNKVGN